MQNLPHNYSTNLAFQSDINLLRNFYENYSYHNSLPVKFPRRQGREGCGIRKTGFWILWEQFSKSDLRVSRIRKSTSCNIHPKKVHWSLKKSFLRKTLYWLRICHKTSHLQALFREPCFTWLAVWLGYCLGLYCWSWWSVRTNGNQTSSGWKGILYTFCEWLKFWNQNVKLFFLHLTSLTSPVQSPTKETLTLSTQFISNL